MPTFYKIKLWKRIREVCYTVLISTVVAIVIQHDDYEWFRTQCFTSLVAVWAILICNAFVETYNEMFEQGYRGNVSKE